MTTRSDATRWQATNRGPIGTSPQTLAALYVVSLSLTASEPDATKAAFPGTSRDEATQRYDFVLTQIAGEPLESYLRRRLLEPIGIGCVRW